MAGRFIKLYDKILQWEWFSNPNTLQLFIYLLLKANYKESVFQGVKIERGQVLTSISKLGQATGQSIRQIRDNLNHLEMTGEVTSQSTNRYRIITIVRYDEYQTSDKQNDKQMTSKPTSQPTSKTTSQPTPSIEYIESIEDIERIESPKGERTTAKRFVPPSKEEILDFCIEEGFGIDVDYLYDYYSSKGWKIGSSTMKDWRAAVRNWARRDEKTKQQAPAPRPVPVRKVTAQQYTQRDYSDEQAEAMARMIAMYGGGNE